MSQLVLDQRQPTQIHPGPNTELVAITLLVLNGFSKFFAVRFFSKFAAKFFVLNIPLHLICVATLPCETIMSENQR